MAQLIHSPPAKDEPPRKVARRRALMRLVLTLALFAGGARAQTPVGEVKGTAWQHTATSAAAAIAQADVALPANATGGAIYFGKLSAVPPTKASVPVIVFLHGSSGLGLSAIGAWQRWLAAEGYASVAPDSMVLHDRITYTSPVSREVYEKIHALRASEIALALTALHGQSWADSKRLILSGASEGGPAVARYAGSEFAGRVIFSWSCEDNYFVTAHRTAVRPGEKILNIMSASDPFFSPANAWLDAPRAVGHCVPALRDDKAALIVLIPGAPHTLLNLPQARLVLLAWLRDVIGP